MRIWMPGRSSCRRPFPCWTEIRSRRSPPAFSRRSTASTPKPSGLCSAGATASRAGALLYRRSTLLLPAAVQVFGELQRRSRPRFQLALDSLLILAQGLHAAPAVYVAAIDIEEDVEFPRLEGVTRRSPPDQLIH